MKNIQKLCLVFLCLLAAASCGKIGISSPGTHAIRCRVVVNDTKSVPITTDGANSTTSITSTGFKLLGYADEDYYSNDPKDNLGSETNPKPAGKYFESSVTHSSGWSVSGSPEWLNGVNIQFFGYAPMSPSGSFSITRSDTDTSDELSFSYTAPIPATNSNSQDIVFSYASKTVTYDDKGNIGTGLDENIDLEFYHALSQIRFCVSTDDDTFSDELRLISIVLKGAKKSDGTYPGLVTSGTCVFDGGDSDFDWTMGSTMSNYTQAFGTGGADFSSSTPTGWTKGTYTKNSTTYNLYTCTGDVLFVIPQDHTNCAVDVTVQKGATGTPTTLTAKLPDTSSWVAGMYYTYKIKMTKSLTLTLLNGDWIGGGGGVNL